MLISLPLTYGYLSKSDFGVLTTIVSVMSLLSFADLGVGFGLQNKLPTLVAEEKDAVTRNYVSTTWTILVFLSSLLGFLFFSGIYLYEHYFDVLGWNEVKEGVVTFFVCFVVGIPFTIIQRIQIGLQEGHKMQIWSAIGTVSGLFGLLFATNFKLSLPWLVFSQYGIPQLVLIVSFLYNFWFIIPSYFPKVSNFEWKICKVVLSTGIIFVVSQIASSALASSNNLIIANQMGANEVGDFSIVLRFATLLTTPIILVLPAILPSINDAFAKGDSVWVKNVYQKVLFVILLFTVMIAFLYVFLGQKLLNIWIGVDLSFFKDSMYSVVFYMFYLQINAFVSYMMLTNFYVKFLAKIYPLAVGVTLILKYFSCCYFGKIGLIYSETFSMLVLFCLPSIILIKKNKHI
jgi:O-antigen/teichoic acid export membrane protein